MLRRTQYINEETGEFTEKFSYVNSLYSKKGYVYLYNGSHVKAFPNYANWNGVNPTFIGYFVLLERYIIEGKQILAYKTKEGLEPLTPSLIAKELGVSDRQARRFVQEMLKFGIYKEVRVGDVKYIAVNPNYGLKGKYLTCFVYKIFWKELIDTIPDKIKEELEIDYKLSGLKIK